MSYTFTFTQEQLQIINDGIVNLPYIKAAPLINFINQEITKQIQKDSDGKDQSTTD